MAPSLTHRGSTNRDDRSRSRVEHYVMKAIAVPTPSAVVNRGAARRKRPSTRFTQTEITRAVQGVRRAGYEPRAVSIDSDGRISIQLTDDAASQTGSWDDVQ